MTAWWRCPPESWCVSVVAARASFEGGWWYWHDVEASWFHPGAEAESSLRCHRRGRPRAIETLGGPGRVWEGTQVAVQYDIRPHVALYGHV